ncbi:predicted protein [Micromonas commoda]|uniref:Uncharacterized protein n=1 Tax=Micromonas commoda (strain RCC299 / NOUM17 / CCMP2709) TaxID=296587 RepID=C1FDS2_MICCC|nr:predicted protein [Micromonas commoda]ACO68442.1 predicted protein [Micromonas commoda]|eukprot:XP_002507184.1 predicted protein [Micromonas commoda]
MTRPKSLSREPNIPVQSLGRHLARMGLELLFLFSLRKAPLVKKFAAPSIC